MDYRVFSSPTHVTVIWQGISPQRGTAEADMHYWMGEGHWHIARVLVQPSDARGQGIGQELVSRLKDAIRKEGGKLVTVDPGGYGMDYRMQKSFYAQCGFEEQEEGRMACVLQQGEE